MNGNQQIDLNTVFNYMFLMVFVVMMFRVMDRALTAPKPKMLYPGKTPPGYKPVHHSSEVTVECPICKTLIEIPEYDRVSRSEALRKHLETECSRGGEYGTCYEDAWRFVIRQEEGELIHGTVLSEERRVGHAWVELPTSYIWEPETGRYYTPGAFNIAASPIEEQRYTTEEAAIMAAKTGNLGPWTEEERKAILKESSFITEVRERITAGMDVR